MSNDPNFQKATGVAESANRQAERLRSLLAEAQRAAEDRDAERVARIARRWRGRA